MRDVLIGQTDYTVLVKIVGTDGAPETGLTEASIDIAYSRVETDNDVTTTDVTPAALTALTDAHTDWGFEEVSSTDHPGLYRLDIADAVFASGAWEAVVTITDASGTDFYPVDIGFRLVSFNAQDGVRLGLTALPNAAANAAGGLVISDAGGFDIDNRAPAAASITNMNTVFNSEFASAWNVPFGEWNVNSAHAGGTAWNSGAIVAATLGSDAITAAKIADGAIDAATLAADALAAIQSECNDAIVANRLDELLAADSDIDGAAPPTVGSVFHELMTKTAGSFTYDQTTDSLEALRDRGDAAWVTATGFSTLDAAGVRTAVGLASANLDTQLADLPTVAEFEARTLVAASYFDPAADTVANVTTVGSVTGAVGSVTGAVGSVTGNVGGNVTGSVGSLATQAKADVNAEVLDVLNTDTFAQPGQESPAATTTLQKMIAYLYKAWRNKSTQTSSEYALYADDGSTKDQEAAVSDDGTTTTRGEVGTGA